MAKIYRIIAALALFLTITTAAIVTEEVLPVSAWTASCTFSPGSPIGSSYGGAFCSTNRIGGAFHKVVINCKYVLWGVSHTYNVYGALVSDNQWSWANCGNHYKDGPNASRPDWVIHIHADFYPSDQYSGGGSSGSW